MKKYLVVVPVLARIRVPVEARNEDDARAKAKHAVFTDANAAGEVEVDESHFYLEAMHVEEVR